MSNEDDWDFAGADEAKMTIRAASSNRPASPIQTSLPGSLTKERIELLIRDLEEQ
jgi:hypothetical protein